MEFLLALQKWFMDSYGQITIAEVGNWFVYNPKEPILFNTPFFLGIFLVFYPIYILTTKASTRMYRNIYVFAFSLFFYYKSSGIYFFLLLFSGVIDFTLAKFLYQETDERFRKFFIILSVVFNLGFLGYFKYSNFMIESYNGLFEGNLALQNIILPVGISFYTFQSMSYIIDIYRKELEPTKNFFDYMFFVSFFPQLVAGPIVRASEFIPQIYKKTTLSRTDVNNALFMIIGGLIKKTVVSDYISLNFVDRIFDAPKSYTAFENLMAAYGYTLQIYCDFSGYSDMAIGIALLMGFKLSTNFITPYKSASITEFWRRWHISLSTWLRDYLYITIGGNRSGSIAGFLFPALFFTGLIAYGLIIFSTSPVVFVIGVVALIVFILTILFSKNTERTMYTNVNMMTTMLLGGFWHGASVRYIVWGALHGMALAINKVFAEYIPDKKDGKWTITKGAFHIISVLITFNFVAFCWIFFRAGTFDVALDVLNSIQQVTFEPAQWLVIIEGYENVFIVMLFGFAWHFLPTRVVDFNKVIFDKMPVVFKAFTLAMTFWVVYATSTSGPQPFIYFQF